MVKKYTGANWNEQEDSFTQKFLNQNQTQFWMPEEIPVANDLVQWKSMPDKIKTAYNKNLQVLTFLDTYQGDIGMTVVSDSIPADFHQRKAVLNFMASMENGVHAKSYSNIFMTYISKEQIDELFEWGEDNPHLQAIVHTIVSNYEKLKEYNYLRDVGKQLETDKVSKYEYLKELLLLDGGSIDEVDKKIDRIKSKETYLSKDSFIKKAENKLFKKTINEEDFLEVQWKAFVSSVFLETYLFYSGFYYPLYFYGKGQLMQAGELINLIIRDEQVHGIYIGLLAQEVFNKFDKEKQEKLKKWMYRLMDKLYYHQEKLMEEIYNPVNITDDVKKFVKYNGNKAMMNLGFEAYFEEEPVNPVVLKGLDTTTKTTDIFSMKGNGYQKINSEDLEDDFIKRLNKLDTIALKIIKKPKIDTILFEGSLEDILPKIEYKLSELDCYAPTHITEINKKVARKVTKALKQIYKDNITKRELEDFVLGNDFYTLDILNKYLYNEKNISEEDKKDLIWLREYYEQELEDLMLNDNVDDESIFDKTSFGRELLLDILLNKY